MFYSRPFFFLKGAPLMDRDRRRRINRYLARYDKLTPEQKRLHSAVLLAWFVRALTSAGVTEAARGRKQCFE